MKTLILAILFAAFAYPQCQPHTLPSDSTKAAWLQLEQWEIDQRVLNSFQWQNCNCIGQTTLPGATSITEGYNIEYVFVIDKYEIQRTDNFVYQLVLTSAGTMEYLGFHPVLEDGYASYIARDAAGDPMLVRVYTPLWPESGTDIYIPYIEGGE